MECVKNCEFIGWQNGGFFCRFYEKNLLIGIGVDDGENKFNKCPECENNEVKYDVIEDFKEQIELATTDFLQIKNHIVEDLKEQFEVLTDDYLYQVHNIFDEFETIIVSEEEK